MRNKGLERASQTGPVIWITKDIMTFRIILTLCFILLCTAASADSLAVTLKPSKGLAGTTSFNIHDDGRVTVLVYESASKITENTLAIKTDARDELRSLALACLESYLVQDRYDHVKEHGFTMSVAHSVQGVTKSISSKRISDEAIKMIERIIQIAPDVDLKFVAAQI